MTMANQPTPADLLRTWQLEYFAADKNLIGKDSVIIRALETDMLGYDEMETKIQQIMSTAGVVVTQGFCVQCHYLLEHWPDLPTEESGGGAVVARSFDTKETEAAARNGCRFCAFLHSRLMLAGLLDTIRKLEARLRALSDDGDCTCSLSIESWTNEETKPQVLWVNLPGKTATHCNAENALVTKFMSHIVTSTPRFDDVFNIARAWLSDCSESHDCTGEMSHDDRPARLIHICDDNEESIQLLATSALDTMPRYAILSYCHGEGDEGSDGTSRSMSSLELISDSTRRTIPLHSLPQMFQDATRVTRRLGLAYIWIKALCATQNKQQEPLDKENDRSPESAHMASILAGAHVNLAAYSATNVYEGLLFPRPKVFSGGFSARVSDGSATRIFHSINPYCETTMISSSSYSLDVWGLTARLLVPRTLSVGDRGLFWECGAGMASEFLPGGFSGLTAGTSGTLGRQTAHQPWDWFDIVWHYSGARFGCGSDRLAALSGVAARHHNAVTAAAVADEKEEQGGAGGIKGSAGKGDQYLAGMWRNQLVYQLPWMIVSRDEDRRERPAWRAPSWSWAAVDGRVTYWVYWNDSEEMVHPHVRVLDARTTPAGSDPFGAVTDGRLTLACSSIARGTLRRCTHGPELVWLEAGLRPVPVTLDCLDEESFHHSGSVFLLPLFSGESGVATMGPTSGAQGAKAGGEEGDGNNEDEERYDEVMIRGLVLQRCGDNRDSRSGQFRRVGAFDLRHDPCPGENLEATANQHYYELLSVLEKVGTATARSECERALDDLARMEQTEAQYVITLV